jgi:hypothetical protein
MRLFRDFDGKEFNPEKLTSRDTSKIHVLWRNWMAWASVRLPSGCSDILYS